MVFISISGAFAMKFIIKTIALFAVTATVAYASCPTMQPYGCRPGPNGKQICGCGQGR